MNLGEKVSLGKRVAVIGGGNVAMDAVRTAVRTGSQEVFILYRRSRAEMPASPEEISEALEEGIRMEFLAAPVRIQGENGKVTGIECIRMELGEPDASGRRRPVPVKGSEFTIACDSIVPAIGQAADLSFIPKESGIAVNKWNTFDVDPVTFATSVPGIFAGGDNVTGPATVVKAVYAGKEAAVSIGRYLSGQEIAAGRAKDWKKGSRRQGRCLEGGQASPGEVSAAGGKREEERLSGGGDRVRRGGGRPGGEPLSCLRDLLRVLPVRRRLHRERNRP